MYSHMDEKLLNIGEYLIQKIYESGARHVFGVPGDYILNFYAKLNNSPLELINTSDEEGAAFAADAYARVSGFGVVCVTYTVGGLKVLNATACAFAEKSPVHYQCVIFYSVSVYLLDCVFKGCNINNTTGIDIIHHGNAFFLMLITKFL